MDFTPVKLALHYCETDFTPVKLALHYCEMEFTPVKLALRYCEMDFSHVNLAPHYCEMNFRPVKMIFHVVWWCVFPKTKNYGRKNTVLARGKHLSGRIGGGRSLFVGFDYLSAACSCHNVPMASDGICQSPLGLSEQLPTFGPSGRHERLNCCWKKRRQKVCSQ